MNACSRLSISRIVVGVTLVVVSSGCARSQDLRTFQQTYLVALQEPVVLEVDVESGQLQILYSRDGQVSLSASMEAPRGARANEESVPLPLVGQDGNHLVVRVPGAAGEQKNGLVRYRIDVPYRTVVISRVGNGKQEISGIMGPVKTATESGDTRISYVSEDVAATVGNGNLDLEVIGGRIQARVRRGNISCTRAAQGIAAQSEHGDITLMAIGPSTAKVKEGSGRIEVSGAHASLAGSTDSGDIHVKAVVHDNWQMSSRSGNIRLELPPDSSFILDASAADRGMVLDQDGLEETDAETYPINQTVNGGAKRIDVHTETGQVVVR